ncbi:MAG: methyltransferase [Oscillospiraceae bacterium]|jgi:16S rRNA (guanine1207-N2)-methyltransferase|nr:methyltransferase [Oscillospiraceae bacterium]
MPASRFSSHYFTPPSDTLHRPCELTVTDGANELTFATDAGVFSRGGLDEGTRILLDAMKPFEPMSGRALDLGCGWGALGITLASRNPALDVTMSDVNPRAVLLTNENIRRNGLSESRARAVESDGLAGVAGMFDWILTNPPIRAGKPTVQRLILEATARMMDAGRLVLVWRKQQGAPSAMKWLGEWFSRVERIDRESGYWVIMCGND